MKKQTDMRPMKAMAEAGEVAELEVERPAADDWRKKRAALQAEVASATKECAAARETFYASERRAGALEAQLRECEAALMDSMG